MVMVKSWAQLSNRLRRDNLAGFAFRGQSCEFGSLQASLYRDRPIGNDVRELLIERELCQRFREHASNYLSSVEREYLKSRWLGLVLMQHYGAPTRLLDWSKSGWIAAFFAASGSWTKDGVIYGFQRQALENAALTKYPAELQRGVSLIWGLSPDGEMTYGNTAQDSARLNDKLFKTVMSDWVTIYYVRHGHFPRLIAQQGLFTFAGRPNVDHWQRIKSLLSPSDHVVLRIAANAKPEILRGLHNMGINGATLAPGLDGVGQYLNGFLRGRS